MAELRRAWKGRIRQSINRTSFDLLSLTNYNAKHPKYNFLTAAQLTAVQNAILTCTQLLEAKVLR